MPSTASTVARGESGPWIRDKNFDLFFLTLSGALVFFPYLSYGLLQRLGVSASTSSLIVGLSVTVLVGGPHMYSTYLRTAFEPRFRRRHPILTYLPLVAIPTLVILGSMYAFIVLLTGFFLWASIHVTHQAQYISETYRIRAGAPVRALDRWLDGAVILGALYTMAMYKFVADRFALGSSVLLFPDFLKHRWVPIAFTIGYAAFFLFYASRTFAEIRRGESSWPRLLFMAVSVLGAAEIAYHAQSLPLLALFGLPAPVLMPRTHVVVRGPVERRLAEQLQVADEDLLVPFTEPLPAAVPQADALASLGAATEKSLAGLSAELERLDPTLTGALDNASKKIAHQFEQLADRARKAAERRGDVATNRRKKLERALLPAVGGVPAERVYPPLCPMLAFGREEVLSSLRAVAGQGPRGAVVVDWGAVPVEDRHGGQSKA